MRKVRIDLMMRSHVKDWLQDRAKAEGVSVSEYVEGLVTAEMEISETEILDRSVMLQDISEGLEDVLEVLCEIRNKLG